MASNRRIQGIYRSRIHLFLTFLIILLPLSFLFLFSFLTGVDLGSFVSQLAISTARLFTAYSIAITLALLVGIFFSRGKLGDFMLPVFDVLQSFPTFATLPLAVTYFGASNKTVVVFLILTVIWPILFSLVSALRSIKPGWDEAVKMAHLSRFDYFRYFLWPASVPGLITGSIIGLGEGWEALIATEIIVKARPGLGEFFSAYSSNPPITFLGILSFLLIIFSINKLFWLPLLTKSHKKMTE